MPANTSRPIAPPPKRKLSPQKYGDVRTSFVVNSSLCTACAIESTAVSTTRAALRLREDSSLTPSA